MDYPKVKVCLDTSEDNLIDELYTPCLKWAERFDRGVGYFTTGWLTYNVAGLSDFASRGGKMRLITSPILSTEDTDAIIGAENQDGSAFLRLEAALLENVEILKQEMEADIINAFSWMLYDGIIDMRFAIPCEKLEEGDFHDKFGIFYKGNDALSFSGSINDSKHGFQNYESIKVFKTWAGTQEYVDADTARFEKIWNRKDRNLKMFTIPQAVKNKIFELRSPDRPYSLPAGSSKWVHQDIAVKTFLEKEHFYTPPELSAQKQEIEECHRALSEALGKPERRLVLRIIDAKDRIAEDTAIDSFITGFELAWELSMELNYYENERSVSCRTAMELRARFTSKEEEK